MPNWKEQWKAYSSGEAVDPIPFIQTEIIEKVIEEIPDETKPNGWIDLRPIKQQLRAKWGLK